MGKKRWSFLLMTTNPFQELMSSSFTTIWNEFVRFFGKLGRKGLPLPVIDPQLVFLLA